MNSKITINGVEMPYRYIPYPKWVNGEIIPGEPKKLVINSDGSIGLSATIESKKPARKTRKKRGK